MMAIAEGGVWRKQQGSRDEAGKEPVFVEQTDVVDDLLPHAWANVPEGLIGDWWCVTSTLAAAVAELEEAVASNGSSFWWYVPESRPEARLAALELSAFIA
jgi:hypothetical protein